jgi:hypothetical protein
MRCKDCSIERRSLIEVQSECHERSLAFANAFAIRIVSKPANGKRIGSYATLETLTEWQDLQEFLGNTEPQLIDPGCKFARRVRSTDEYQSIREELSEGTP